MSGVGTQGDPCTATIFRPVMHPYLLYSASSTIPLTNVKYLTQRNLIIGAWSLKTVYLSDEICIQIKTSPFFPCTFLVVRISPTRTGELKMSTTSRAPWGCKPFIRRGAARCPEGTVCDTGITTSVPRSLQHDASHLGFGGPGPCLLN
jgi:hypothetical protein